VLKLSAAHVSIPAVVAQKTAVSPDPGGAAVPASKALELPSALVSEKPGLPVLKAEAAASGLERETTPEPVGSSEGPLGAEGRVIEDLAAAQGSLSEVRSLSTVEAAKSASGEVFGEARGRKGFSISAAAIGIPAGRVHLGKLLPPKGFWGKTPSKVSEPGSSGQDAPPAKPSGWRNILRGAYYGLVLIVSPIATSFAFDPVDHALGLHAFPLLKHLTQAYPAFGVPFAWFWTGFSVLIPLFGFFAIKKGVRSLWPSQPWAPMTIAGLVVAGTAAAAVIFHALPAVILMSMLSTTLLATGEEAMFRAGFLPWLKRRFETRGVRWAVPLALVISSAVFSLVHLPIHAFTLDLFVLKFVLGLVFGLLYLRTGNLAAPAAAPSAYNILVGGLSPLVAVLAGLPLVGAASVAVMAAALFALRAGWFSPKPAV
jgi:membrane protease YdiL (CAAX protease family)